ncbi:hypothetical protein GYMLUDRAFT_260265 [Collybiopsis luxurians FD-317 M1]|uniref:Pyranose dehydrogenase (acceptor) n=1 Tax=Collybiopsis luxurians FD-317 M1 TaxID=944289 RepID=A0A0D0CIQ4_9AGAR|nr:hypothetical protein GYMLUDRAFT_260265 [Collybiopsis luxurians FD-317 M1]
MPIFSSRMLLYTLFSFCFFNLSSAASFHRNPSLEKRFDNAPFTFYNVGTGTCGKTNVASDFVVALNVAQYGSGQDCFRTINISYGGKSTQAQIVDEELGLDLSIGLFEFFAPLSDGLLIGILYNNFSDLPSRAYDFVIIGGGTAGSVVANRLTENPESSVLIIEAGGTNIDAFQLDVPFFASIFKSQYDWNFTTTVQQGLNNHSTFLPRGFVLGGSSSVNGMVYTRGSADDYDRWATVTKDDGWSWDNLQPFIAKNEKWELPADRHNTTGQFNPSVHSLTGVNAVSLSGFSESIDPMIFEAVDELGGIFNFNQDYNSGNPLGFGWLQLTISTEGRRSSSATSYLAPKYIERKNLDVLLHARASRVLPSVSKSSLSGYAFRTVEFAQDLDGPLLQVNALKEVILSAGVIGSPHILLNSGIGDSDELSEIGIKSLVNLPSVGKNLTDQPAVTNVFLVNSNKTTDDLLRNATLLNKVYTEFNKTGMGPLVVTGGNQISFFRASESLTHKFGDPSSGRNSPHLEMLPANGFYGIPPPAGHFLTLETTVVSPASRGSLTINSTNPFANPLIDPGYLTSPFDIAAMREVIRITFQYLSAPIWDGYLLSQFGDFANITATSPDNVLDEYIRNNAGSSGHPVGTAAMSAKDADYGVVDPDLRVKRVEGLRMIDSSVFPFVTSAHTQAPTYVIAERAAALVQAAWV